MCYHNSLNVGKKQLISYYHADMNEHVKFDPIYHHNGFGKRPWPVITDAQPHTLQLFQWQLIPPFAKAEDVKDGKYSFNTLNAIGEEIFEKASYRKSIMEKRCLVPSTGFFEFKHEGLGKDAVKKGYFIYVKDQPIFSLAGVWNTWWNKETAESFDTFSIVTVAANELMSEIHNTKKRMPVIIPREIEGKWLQPKLQRNEIASMIMPFDTNLMAAHQISKLITTRGADSNVPMVSEECVW